jgi:hypothetical protein
MKLKNVRVRLKDLHHGKILYIAEPRCGIEAVQVIGKPKIDKYVSSLFIDVLDNENYKDLTNLRFERLDNRSLSDMGVYKQYGYRRTFHKLKQAEAYVARMRKDPGVNAYWNRRDRYNDFENTTWDFCMED